MTPRILILAAVIGLALAATSILSRRKGTVSDLPVGLTLVTGAECRLCPMAVEAASQLDMPVRIVDVHDFTCSDIRSLPTLFAADNDGGLLARRAGRSVITEMARMAALAAGSTTP